MNAKHILMLIVTTGAIKSWQASEPITATDLNANFSHIHSKMVGGHGAKLIDADVSASANIASNKLAAYRFIPKAWAAAQTKCSGVGTCTLSAKSTNIASVTSSGTGTYQINMATPLTDTNFALVINGWDGTNFRGCYQTTVGLTTSAIPFLCDSDFTSTNADASFTFTIMDDN